MIQFKTRAVKFFEPDQQLVKSLAEYIGSRNLIEIGCRNGDLLKSLHVLGCKCTGVDPYTDNSIIVMNDGIINILPFKIEDHPNIIENLQGIILIARPCHSGFVQFCLENKNENTELIYIGLEMNFEADGIADYKYERIELKGKSIDNELILSIK